MPTLEREISSRVILTFIGLILLAYQGFEADSGVISSSLTALVSLKTRKPT